MLYCRSTSWGSTRARDHQQVFPFLFQSQQEALELSSQSVLGSDSSGLRTCSKPVATTAGPVRLKQRTGGHNCRPCAVEAKEGQRTTCPKGVGSAAAACTGLEGVPGVLCWVGRSSSASRAADKRCPSAIRGRIWKTLLYQQTPY